MTVTELARRLGEAIAADPILEKYKAAKAAYEANGELRDALYEYEAQRSILSDEYQKPDGERNEGLVKLARERMDQLAKQIVAAEEYRDYTAAEQDVNRLMQEVNSEIGSIVFGTSACTHDCSTCHAACASKQNDN